MFSRYFEFFSRTYVKYYTELWDDNKYVKNYIIDKLNVYRDKYRNDHLHKDNIKRIEKIEEIRTNTILIYYLLLGAMKISDSDKEQLGIVSKEKEDKIKQDMFLLNLLQYVPNLENGKIYSLLGFYRADINGVIFSLSDYQLTEECSQ